MNRYYIMLCCAAIVFIPALFWLGGWNFTRGEAGFFVLFLVLAMCAISWPLSKIMEQV